MAEDDETASAAKGKGPQRQKRPPVTIDLEAESPAKPAEEPIPAAPEAEPAPRSDAPEAPPADSLVRRLLPLGVAAIIGGVVGGSVGALLFAPQSDTITAASIDSRFATLASRLDALDAQAGQQGTGAAAADAARIAALETAVEKLGTQTPANAPATDLQPIEQRLATLEARPVQPATPPVDLAPLEQKLGALDGRIAAIEQHPPSDPATEAAARTIAITALRQAALGDRPFSAELSAFQTVAGDQPGLTALAPLAADGAPSRASLQASFPAAAEAVRSAGRRIDPEAGLLDRLTASASALVSVRPAGPVEGSSSTAIVSRMEAEVDKGDLSAALAESEMLDAPSKSALSGWADAARRRIAIDSALAALSIGN